MKLVQISEKSTLTRYWTAKVEDEIAQKIISDLSFATTILKEGDFELVATHDDDDDIEVIDVMILE